MMAGGLDKKMPHRRKSDTVFNLVRHAKIIQNTRMAIVPVIFSCKRSVWKSVWKVVALNTVLACAVHWLRANKVLNLAIDNQGHTVAGALVSFFVVTRLNMAYARSCQGRTDIGAALLAMREFSTHAICLTKHRLEPEIAAWRGELVEGAAALCDELCAALSNRPNSRVRPSFHEMVHNVRFRLFTERRLAAGPLLSEPERTFLMAKLCDFVRAADELGKMMTVLMPFPMLQMSRTLVFTWVFTLPLSLEARLGRLNPLFTFFLTFAFIGIEMMSIEMDDPFGDDENDYDIDSLLLATLCEMDDLLEQCDGPNRNLRALMVEISAQGGHLVNMTVLANEKSALLTQATRSRPSPFMARANSETAAQHQPPPPSDEASFLEVKRRPSVGMA